MHQCAPHDRTTVRNKTQLLKMILSNHAGSRFQMDLIRMPPCRGYTQILRVVDHLIKYGYVAPMRSKNATECTNALLRILSGSIMLRILQSDNDSEVCIYCYYIVICTIRFLFFIKYRYYFIQFMVYYTVFVIQQIPFLFLNY
jgi:hypothetical protein